MPRIRQVVPLFVVPRPAIEQLLDAVSAVQTAGERGLATALEIAKAMCGDLDAHLPLEEICRKHYEAILTEAAADFRRSVTQFEKLYPAVFGHAHPSPERWIPPANVVSCIWNRKEPPPWNCGALEQPAKLLVLDGEQMVSQSRACRRLCRDIVRASNDLGCFAGFASEPRALAMLQCNRGILERTVPRMREQFRETWKCFKESFWLPEAFDLAWHRIPQSPGSVSDPRK